MTTLLGRDSEIAELQLLFENENTSILSSKVILINGEAGIGKTLLADKFCDTEIVRNHFNIRYRISAHTNSWEQIISLLANEILGAMYAKATVDELYSRIVSQIRINQCLLFIDNLDDQAIYDKLYNLIVEWEDIGDSLLVLTGQKFPENFTLSYCKSITLKGLSDPSDINTIVGPLSHFFEDRNLFNEVVKVTNGNPQKLLYLRWRNPKSNEDLSNFLRRFRQDKNEDMSNIVLEIVNTGFVKLDVPIDHFLSLSCLRHPVFDETLLAFLWDRLVGGGTTFYINVLNRLLQEGLLSIQEATSVVADVIPEKGVREFRLNSTFHSRLQKAFSNIVTRERQAHIQFYIGEYYRNQFSIKYKCFLEENNSHTLIEKRKPFPMEEFDAFAYHTIAGGHVETVYKYAFTNNRLELAHAAGSSLGLKQVLEMLLNGINRKISKINESVDSGFLSQVDSFQEIINNLKENLQRFDYDPSSNPVFYHLNCIQDLIHQRSEKRTLVPILEARSSMINAELGRTNKDLNYYDEALQNFESASRTLEKPDISNQLKTIGALRLPADLAHYKGIVHSITGEMAESLQAYFFGIHYAVESECFTAKDSLSMGYLAYVLKYYDIHAAYRFAEEAVERAIHMGDNIVIAKNFCTRALIESFLCMTSESTNSFQSALDHLGMRDVREYCRIKIDSSVNEILKGEFGSTRIVLMEVIDKFGETGDRRRIANAKAYLGIIEYHENNLQSGVAFLEEAFISHKDVNSIRECIFDALTFCWINFNQRVDLSSWEDVSTLTSFSEEDRSLIPHPILSFLDNLNNMPNHYIYTKFWFRYYLPVLLKRMNT